jgi:hypothetical protein
MKTEEEAKAVQIMIDAAKDAEYLEDAMLLGYKALKEHKYPKPPEIDMSKITTINIPREMVEQSVDMQRMYSARAAQEANEQAWRRAAAARYLNADQIFIPGTGGISRADWERWNDPF